jgi:N-acetylmuramoyl-L-alanine amidase
MSKKIYISPSSQPANTYAVGNTNEQEQCRKIAAALEKELDRCGFNSKAGLSGTMYTRTAESNSFGADLHLPIHTNAFDGKVAGLRIMVYKKGGEAEKIAKAIMDTLAPITPGTSDGISEYPGLYEIKNSKAICVYIEVGFHDNPEEARWIIDHTQDIAEAICKGLCNHYGVEYIPANAEPQPEVKPAEKTLYRVQVGAFYNKDYAENLRKELVSKGYEDAFIVK